MVLKLSNAVIGFIINTIIYFLPALIANGAPVIFIGKVIKSPRPLDRGRKFIDGKPILGPNKTIEGFLIGCLSGLITGIAYTLITHNRFFILYGLIMGLGAMIGDAINSFVKRRINIRSGDPFIPMDQLSFIIMSYVFIKLFELDKLCGIEVTLAHFSMIVVIVMILHPLTNMISYLIGLKDKPW